MKKEKIQEIANTVIYKKGFVESANVFNELEDNSLINIHKFNELYSCTHLATICLHDNHFSVDLVDDEDNILETKFFTTEEQIIFM